MYNVELYYTAVGQGIPALYINSVISVIVATGCRVESQYSSLPDHVTMAATKKRKVDTECRIFQEKWTNDYFFAKSRLRSRLTDANLEKQLRVATSSVAADTARLVKEKQSQPSH